MPAIQPAQLKQQAALLAEHFHEPAAFARSLHHLLDLYADRARRLGHIGIKPSLLEAYHVRPPVLRQVTQELTPRLEADPDAGLRLCRALWEQPILEFRTLAIQCLGRIPPQRPESILELLLIWVQSHPEDTLLTALLTDGLARLRREDQPAFLAAIESWMASSDLSLVQMGLRAALPLLESERFENLPAFFRLIAPLTRLAPTVLRPDLLAVLAALARRSPAETAYFLEEGLALPRHSDTAWLIRRLLKDFPAPQAEKLRAALRAA
jgi:hypothetical protein